MWYQKVNESPWMGSICEVGIGVPFQAAFLEVPGASQTILFTHCPYHKELQGLEFSRSVSYETASLYAWDDMHRIMRASGNVPREHVFSLAVTASHKMSDERGMSHGWVVLLVKKEDTDPLSSQPEIETDEYAFHFRLPKYLNRKEGGRILVENIKWFMNKVLLCPDISWGDAIRSRWMNAYPYGGGAFDMLEVDVIRAPDITIEEHLLLAGVDTPLLYHEGEFKRPVDYIRRYNRVLPGSFNPPTIAHLSRSDQTLLSINFENPRKETISEEDMAHRIRMLDLEDVPVLILRKRPYIVYLHDILVKMGMEKPTYLMGVDTFNALCDDRYILSRNFLEPLYRENGATFEVLLREGYGLIHNEWSHRLKTRLLQHKEREASSTRVRQGEYDLTTPAIRRYIEKNNLYGSD
jgi:hypothetical protein